MGKNDNLDRADWLAFAQRCHLPEKTAQRVLAKQAAHGPAARDLIQRCSLPAEMKVEYQRLIEQRTVSLG